VLPGPEKINFEPFARSFDFVERYIDDKDVIIEILY
jgi:hypothetical protein